MGFQVRVEPGGQVFTSSADDTVLDAALRAGIVLPHSCRDGLCGSCRGKVRSGQVEHGDVSPSLLDEGQRARGEALFCRAKARSDLVIEARQLPTLDDAPVLRTLPVRVEKLSFAAPNVIIMNLKLPGGEQLRYLPGQYVEVLLAGGKRRAFSLAGAPHAGACLQLHIRHFPGGLFTDRVFNGMKERDLLRIKGPYGSFFLREDSDKPMLLLARGTGFAPIKAIVEHAIARDLRRPMYFYWGGKQRADLYLYDMAAGWARDYPYFRFTPVLSQAAAGDAWDGRTGLAYQAVLQDFPDLSGFQAYVCGSPNMVIAARREFIARGGLPEEAFFADSFEFSHEAGYPERESIIAAG